MVHVCLCVAALRDAYTRAYALKLICVRFPQTCRHTHMSPSVYFGERSDVKLKEDRGAHGMRHLFCKMKTCKCVC